MLVCRLLLLFGTLLSIPASCVIADDMIFQQEVRPLLIKFCGDCHAADADSEEGVQFLQAETIHAVSLSRSLWSSAAEQLRNRTMPPADEAQPSEQQRLELADWITKTLRETACAQGPFAAEVTTRRLNRLEYSNTIRDLLGVETDAAVRFPVDGSGGEGFNNNGETLFLPPLLLERYLEAADQIMQVAIPAPALTLVLAASELQPPLSEGTASSRTISTQQSVHFSPRIYAAGLHQLKIQVQAVNQPGKLAVKIDGLIAERFEVKSKPVSAGQFPIQLEASLRLTRGIHSIEFVTLDEQPVLLSKVELKRPLAQLSETQRKWIVTLTGVPIGQSPESPRETAHKVISQFLPRAFRRQVSTEEIERYLKLYDRAAERGDPYAEALKLAYKGILVSSPFLFRVEAPASSSERQLISNFELATRLSYFLWGTMPDQELFRLAEQERLQNESVLIEQVERMLDDPRSRYFVEEFVGQWLGTKEVGSRIAPDTGKFQGEFSTELLLGFREEPVQFFAYVLRENRPALELLTADYVLVNQRLRKHYGLDPEGQSKTPSWPWTPNPQLSADGPFEKVVVPDERRGGILGMGGVHLLTSYPNRTSPVLRGGWILETLLGVHIPNPPPDVPELSKSKKDGVKTVREQLTRHREPSSCAACHHLIDPPGYALDHYDVLGRWRDQQGEHPVDATATFPSGETVSGLPGLKQVLVSRKDVFYRQLTRKMLGFALGRSLQDRDDCVINQISDHLTQDNDSLRSLINSIVLSVPFRQRQLTDSVEPTSQGGS